MKAAVFKEPGKPLSIENVKDFALIAKNFFNKKSSFDKEWKDFNQIMTIDNIARKECLLLPINATVDALS